MGKTPSVADKLIAEAKAPRVPDPPPEAIAEVDKLRKHNANASNNATRVGGDRVVKMLQEDFAWAGGRRLFDDLCKRKWGSTWGKM